jgi:hypothetical protein
VFSLRPFFIVLGYDLYRTTRVTTRRVLFVMNHFDPNVLSLVNPNSELGRDLAISLQASAEEEEEENNTRLTDE